MQINIAQQKQTYRQPWKRETEPESLLSSQKESSFPDSEKLTSLSLQRRLQTKAKLVNRNLELTDIYTQKNNAMLQCV